MADTADKIRLFTDLKIIPNTSGCNLKRYFNSIKRNLPQNWRFLRNELYSDDDTYRIIHEVICLQTPTVKDTRDDSEFYGKIFLGLTDSSILLLKIDLDKYMEKDETLEHLGYINTMLHEQILKPNKYYSNFNHNFDFGGPSDENWHRSDLRDKRLIRVHSKKDNTVFSLAESNSTAVLGKKIHYTDPNNISLSLSLMKKSYKKAKSIYQNLISKNQNTKIEIATSQRAELYDYFEEVITSVIFSYISVEAFSNAAIPENYEHIKVNERGIKEIWSKENIERWMPTSEKVGNLLPQILNSSEIKEEKFWGNFKDLEKLRNHIVHQKTVEQGTKLSSEIFKELLDPTVFDKIRSSISVIQFFYDLDNKHPYFPLGFGIAKFQVVTIESFEKHFQKIEDEQD